MNYIIIYVTTKDEDEAQSIGMTLVRERLAACANVIPSVKSVYWWKGKVEQDTEAVLLVKSTKSKSNAIVKRVNELHSYDVPCIDVLPIKGGNEEYFRWLDESLKGG